MPQCEATTKEGARCKREALPGSRFCAQHEALNQQSAEEVGGLGSVSQPEPAPNGDAAWLDTETQALDSQTQPIDTVTRALDGQAQPISDVARVEEETVEVIREDKPVRVRYKGNGTYFIPHANAYFSARSREQMVSRSLADYLTGEEPRLFEVLDY